MRQNVRSAARDTFAPPGAPPGAATCRADARAGTGTGTARVLVWVEHFGWAKIAYEHLGFLFACGAFGRKMGVVQIRIGAPREIVAARFQGRPERYKRDLGAWISERDMQQLFVKSIEAEHIENEHGIPFQVFYGISNNARTFWSIANARRVIGYEPQDDSEIRYADDIRRMIVEPDVRGRL